MIQYKIELANLVRSYRGLVLIYRRACEHVHVSTPSFGSHLNPIPNRGGTDYAHHILMAPPSFESHRRTCIYLCVLHHFLQFSTKTRLKYH